MAVFMYPFDFIIYILLIEWKILVAASTLLLSKLFKWFLLILFDSFSDIAFVTSLFKTENTKMFSLNLKTDIITVLNRILITHIYHS